MDTLTLAKCSAPFETLPATLPRAAGGGRARQRHDGLVVPRHLLVDVHDHEVAVDRPEGDHRARELQQKPDPCGELPRLPSNLELHAR